MLLTTYEHAVDFLAATEDYLLQDETVTMLLLGVARRVAAAPTAYGATRPYFAAVTQEEPVGTGSTGLVLCAIMTPPFNLILHSDREDAGEAPALVAANLQHDRWPVEGVTAPVRLAAAFAEIYMRQTGGTSKIRANERLYRLTEVWPPAGVPGALRPARAADVDLAASWLAEFHAEATPDRPLTDFQRTAEQAISQERLYLWDDGGPVSLAGTNRSTAHGASVGPVYTPPALRRRGYASACVAALSQLLLDRGYQFCTLFTNLANPISNAIYRQINYRPVCDFLEIGFHASVQ
jgi:uncharacterized protein